MNLGNARHFRTMKIKLLRGPKSIGVRIGRIMVGCGVLSWHFTPYFFGKIQMLNYKHSWIMRVGCAQVQFSIAH